MIVLWNYGGNHADAHNHPWLSCCYGPYFDTCHPFKNQENWWISLFDFHFTQIHFAIHCGCNGLCIL